MNKVGIILTTWNLLEETRKTIVSLIQNTSNYELVVVDNASNDGTQEWIKLQGFSIIELTKNTDLAAALNLGIRYFFNKENNDVHYDMCWIHNDMIFYPNWLTKLQEYFEKHPECAKVASHNMRDSLAPERPGNELPCLIRGAVLKKIGLYDERYIGCGGYEDWDMNKRLLNDGYIVMITPESKVFHKGMATRSLRNTDPEAQHNSHQYLLKWGNTQCPV
jgi:GT2 family glycosyltransferase